jgi:hypothetical protein
MIRLLQTQDRFQQHMLGAADVSPLLNGSAECRALGLAIYANAYRSRLVEALADAYAKVRMVLGAEPFETTARAYIAAHPPTTRSLRWFGGGFADHLRAASPDQAAIAELAALEWALRNAFDGPDSALLSAEEFVSIPTPAWTTLRLTLVPTAELLHLQHNAVAVWQALDDDAAPPASERSDVGVDWLVWRMDLQPHFRSLPPLEAALLRAMRGGAGFAQACEQAAAVAADDCTADIGVCLRRWLADGVLCKVDDESAGDQGQPGFELFTACAGRH